MFKVTVTKGRRVIESSTVTADELKHITWVYSLKLGRSRSPYKIDVQPA